MARPKHQNVGQYNIAEMGPYLPEPKRCAIVNNVMAVLDSVVAAIKLHQGYKDMYPVVYSKLAHGPERKFLLTVYDTRTACVQMYGLRETAGEVLWKERVKCIPLKPLQGRVQSNVKVVIHQLITRDSIEAGMAIRCALDSTEISGHLERGEPLDLEAALEGIEIDAFEQFYL